ncbi:cellulose binding domain-containing protein [Actinomadura sp. WMMA1423]|uniref:cellulose binding domain-containing protein n=1 Tax=Actinomadura sp. WMMA1423 TaxID=2591108 RepID=UPI0011473963|nr:cellulose binding domain-containing protein [Actinomadura sp. WMMA1423]
MGRHSRLEQPEDDPVPGADASRGSYYGAPVDPSYDIFSGPTDDRVYVSPHDRVRSGPPPVAERQHDPPPEPYRFEPLPGDYPGDYPGSPTSSFPELPRERLLDPAEMPELESADPSDASGKRGWTKLVSVLPLPLLPIVALVIAVGIVSYALSTQQISLNFAGGSPKTSQTDPRDNQVSQRGPGERASRGGRPDGLVVGFRVASRTPGGFKATATIANKGQLPVSKWALAFKIPNATVTALSGATVVRTGEIGFVRGRTGIAPGGTVRIVFTAQGTPSKPSSCVLNKLSCTLV